MEETFQPLEEIKTRTEGLKVFPSNKGTNYTVGYKGFMYIFHITGSNKRIFRCAEHRIGNCHGRLHLTMNYKSVYSEESASDKSHNHKGDQGKIDAKYGMWKMKFAAKTSKEATSSILATGLAAIPSSSLGALPNKESAKHAIRDARRTKNQKTTFSSREEIPDLTSEFQFQSGESFLKFDTGPSTDRTLIFSTQKNLEVLKSAEHWFVDGTFKTAPTLFDQLYVIHGMKKIDGHHTIIPLVYCLTPNRQTNTYIKMLEKLKELIPNLDPISVMSDFETACFKSFKSVFPNIDQRGCFFHFAQCNFKHIQKNPDLLNHYNTNSDFALNIRHLLALAFVPTTDVVACFELLDDSPFFQDHQEILNSYLDYFQNTWIGSFDCRGNRKRPLYDVDLWNCYEAVLQGLPKTNNSAEGFHRGFLTLLGACHPTIFKLIEGLMKQQHVTEYTFEMISAGKHKGPDKNYAHQAARLKRKVERYGAPTVGTMEYLRGIAHCITL